jgi:hypothetical protein
VHCEGSENCTSDTGMTYQVKIENSNLDSKLTADNLKFLKNEIEQD